MAKKGKCVVIREELVALTGDYKRAIVLGQLIYWSERVRDCRLYREEEQRRICSGEEGELTHGWFYKKADHLAGETMMGVKSKAMREHLKYLVGQGWLFERRNPSDKMDRTLQYRVNLINLIQDIEKLGYAVERYTPFSKQTPTGYNEDANSLDEASR